VVNQHLDLVGQSLRQAAIQARRLQADHLLPARHVVESVHRNRGGPGMSAKAANHAYSVALSAVIGSAADTNGLDMKNRYI
jgi:hypothetical protein